MYGSFREVHASLRCMVGLMVWSIPKVSCSDIVGCPGFILFMEGRFSGVAGNIAGNTASGFYSMMLDFFVMMIRC